MFYVPISIYMITQSEIKLLLLDMCAFRSIGGST